MIHSVELRGQKNQKIKEGNWPDLKTVLIFNFQKQNGQIHYSIRFLSLNKKLEFDSKNFILFLQPINELENLREKLQTFLKSEHKQFRFEPAEPNFELILEKDDFDGFKLYCWIDNGNADFAHYTWDSIGLRLYIEKNDLQDFINNIPEFNL